MDNVKQNDWVAINLLNKDVTIDQLSADGINSLNTGIRPKEEYLNSDKVKEFFTDDSGKFNDVLFDTFYTKSLQDYTQFSTLDQEKWLKDNYEYNAFDINIQPGKNVKEGPTFEIRKVANPFETTSYFHEGKEGPRALSIAELAQKNHYYDSASGTWSDKTPNDLGALGTITNDTLVLAQWDSEGEHADSNGNTLKHSKGDYKYDDDGRFYYETLNGRQYYGKQVLGALDVLTTDGSAWNKVDIFDTDNVEVNPIRSIARTLAVAAPYFIPGIGQYWAGTTAALYLSESMPALIKTFGGLLNPEYRPSTALNKFEGFMQKFSTTPSEYNQMHAFSFDNIMQFASTSAQQLFQQRWVANLPKMLGMDKRLTKGVGAIQQSLLEKAVEKGLISKEELLWTTDAIKAGKISAKVSTIIEAMPEYKKAFDIYNKYQKASTAMARAYLVTTAAAQTYGDAIQNGFDTQTASIISTAVYAGFHTLFQFDYFKHYLLTGVDLNEEKMALRELVYKYLSTRGKDELTKELQKKGAAATFNKFSQFLNKTWTEIVHGGRRSIPIMALSEASEEVMEELMTDFAQGVLGNGLNAIKKDLGYETQGYFDYAASDPIQRYLVSFVGGGIGGSIFGLEDWARNRGGASKWGSFLTKRPEMAKQILYKVNSGQKDEIIKIAESFRGKGLGSNTLSYDDRAEDGSYLPAKEKNKTQNAYLVDSFINHVNSLDLFLEQQGIKYSKGDLENAPIYRSLTALQIAQSGDDKLLDLMADDLGRLQLRLNDLSSELYKLNKDKDTDPQLIKVAQTDFDFYKNQLTNLVNGGNEAYFGRLMAAYNPSVFGIAYSPNVEHYAKQVLNLDYKSLNDTLKSFVDEKYKGYVDSGQGAIDSYNSYRVYRRMSEILAESLQNREAEIIDDIPNLTGVIRMDPNSGRMILGDSSNYNSPVDLSYNQLVGRILEVIQNSSLRNDLQTVKSIANYLYAAYKGYKIVPEKLGLIDFFETDEAIQNAYDLDEKGMPVISMDENGNPLYVDEYGFPVEEGTETDGKKLQYVNSYSDTETYTPTVNLVNRIIDVISMDLDMLKPNVYRPEILSDIKQWETALSSARDMNRVLADSYIEVGNDQIDDILKQLDFNPTKWITEELIKYNDGKQTYILETPVREQLDILKSQLDQVKAILNGATTVTRSTESLTSVNQVINDFNKIHKNAALDLPVVSDNVNIALSNTIAVLNSQIEALKLISDNNANNENIKEQKLSVAIKQDRIGVYKQLVSEESVYTNVGLPSLPDFKIIEATALDNLDTDGIGAVDLQLEEAMIANEVALTQYYRALTGEQRETFISLLCDTFKDFHKEPAYLSLNVDQNTDEIHSMDALNFWYLASNLVSEPATFYKAYKEVIKNGEFDKAPYYSQEFLVKQAIQYLNGDKTEINRIISVVERKTTSDQAYSVLENIFKFCAGSGVGKSVAIIPLIQLVQNKISETKYIFSAPTKANLDKLNAERADKYTISDLFKLFEDGVKIVDTKKDEQINYTIEDFNKFLVIDKYQAKFNTSDYSMIVSEELRELFAGGNLIMVIDEGTYVSREQYLLLNEVSKQLGLKILTTGDILQSGYSNKEGIADSFDRCLTFIGSSLYESKRVTTNIGKWNSSRLAKYPYTRNSSVFELQYSEEGNEVVGIKTGAGNLSQQELNDFAAAHPESSILLYNTKSSNLAAPKNVLIKDTVVAIQGQEFDYVLVNGDLDSHTTLPGRKDIYTILTRGKNATIVYGGIKNKGNFTFSNVKKEWKDVYSIGVNEESIKNYQEYRKQSLSKLQVPELEIIVASEEEIPNVEVVPTQQLTVAEVPLIRSMLRMHTFYNRFGGSISEDEIYHRGNDSEDLNIFLTEDADIRSETFKTAAMQLNALKNNLYLKLSGETKFDLFGIDPNGEFLIKVSVYDVTLDNTWGKGNFDPNKDLSKGSKFTRLIYKAGDKEITLAIFPNIETVGRGSNVSGNTALLETIKNLDAEQDSPTYYKFDTDKISFYTPDSPIFFDPIREDFENQRYWTQYKYTKGLSDYEYSFFETTKPIRVSADWLTDKRGEYSISELCTQIDSLYKKVSELWDSNGTEGNPFKQRNGEVRVTSKITKSAATVFAKLRSNYTSKPLSLDNAITQYISDLKQTYKTLTEVVQLMSKSEWTPMLAEQITRKARIRITVQPIQLYYNYSPNNSWADKFKTDVRLIGTKESHNNLEYNIVAWTERLISIVNSEWYKERFSGITVSDLQDILSRTTIIRGSESNDSAVFTNTDPITETRVNQIWDIYTTIYSDFNSFKEAIKGINDNNMHKLYSQVFANYHQTDFDKTYRTNNVPDNIPFTVDNKFVYERGWSVMSYSDYGQGLQTLFTVVSPDVNVEPTQGVIQEIEEKIVNSVEPEADLLTEECMDLLDEYSDYVHQFIHFVRQENNGIFVTRENLTSGPQTTYTIQLGNQTKSYTFSNDVAVKLDAYMNLDKNKAVFEKMKNKSQLVSNVKEILDILTAGEEC